MKAAFFLQTGPPEVIRYGDLPDPNPGPNQCLIRVAAVDVNPIDIYVRSGMVSSKLAFPAILGKDLAGTVIGCGAKVTRFKPGDRVWATSQGSDDRPGTFSELAAIDERWLFPIPAGVNEETVVAMSLVGTTAHLGLVEHARLKSGETLFVNGGTGGVGSSVLQIGKILGARVIATAGSEEKVEACRQMGADLALNYKTADLEKALREFAPGGINVWWETVREPNFERTISLLALRGRMVVMAGRDARPAFPVGPFYTKDCALHGFALFNASIDQQAHAAADLNQWMQAGKLAARIDRVLPLSESAQAHRLQEQSTVQKTGALAGKIVLKP